MQFQMTYHETDLFLGGSQSMIQALTDILSIKNENMWAHEQVWLILAQIHSNKFTKYFVVTCSMTTLEIKIKQNKWSQSFKSLHSHWA